MRIVFDTYVFWQSVVGTVRRLRAYPASRVPARFRSLYRLYQPLDDGYKLRSVGYHNVGADPTEKMRAYFGRLKEGEYPTPLELLIWTRELIEYQELHDKYKVAYLYGCWAVHTRISQSVAGFELLRQVNNHLLDAHRNASGDEEVVSKLNAYISNALGHQTLRKDLQRLFRTIGLSPAFLNDPSGWYQFFLEILRVIHNKPIEYPADPLREWKKRPRNDYEKARRAFDAIFAEPGFVIIGFWIELYRAPDAKPRKASEIYARWNAQSERGVLLRGPLSL